MRSLKHTLLWNLPFSGQTGLFGILLFLCCLLGCSPPEPPLLRVATNVWPGYESLYLARALGYFDQSSIRLVEMTSASQVSHAIRNGTVEVAALTLDETLTLLQDPSLDLRVILIMDISNGADVLLARNTIPNLAELKNKRIGVENTATGAVLLDAALHDGGLSTDDVTIIPMTANVHQNAWQRHEVDALVTFEPCRSALLNLDAHTLFDSSQIPGRIIDVLVVRAEAIPKHKQQLKQLIAGHFQAIHYLTEHTQQAASFMAPRLAANDPQQVLGQFEGLQLPDLIENWVWLSGAEPTLKKSSQELLDLMLKHQLLQNNVALKQFAEPAFLPEPPR